VVFSFDMHDGNDYEIMQELRDSFLDAGFECHAGIQACNLYLGDESADDSWQVLPEFSFVENPRIRLEMKYRRRDRTAEVTFLEGMVKEFSEQGLEALRDVEGVIGSHVEEYSARDLN
jgi:hypothetical protein